MLRIKRGICIESLDKNRKNLLKISVLSLLLRVFKMLECLTSCGKLFHEMGAQTKKTLVPQALRLNISRACRFWRRAGGCEESCKALGDLSVIKEYDGGFHDGEDQELEFRWLLCEKPSGVQ